MLNKPSSEKEQMTQEKKTVEEKSHKHPGSGRLSSRENRNSGSDWKLGEEANLKKGILKQDPPKKHGSIVGPNESINPSRSDSKKSIVKAALPASGEKSGEVSARIISQQKTLREKSETDLHELVMPPLAPKKITEQKHIIKEEAKQMPESPKVLDDPAARQSSDRNKSRPSVVDKKDTPGQDAQPMPALLQTPSTTGGIQNPPKASIAQEKPIEMNKKLESQSIPQLSPIENNVRTEPNQEKPSQSSISKSKKVEENLDKQAADEFVEELFASIIEEPLI